MDSLIGTFNETVELVNLTQDERIVAAAKAVKDAVSHMINTYNDYEKSGNNDAFGAWRTQMQGLVDARDGFYEAVRPGLDTLARQAAQRSVSAGVDGGHVQGTFKRSR